MTTQLKMPTREEILAVLAPFAHSWKRYAEDDACITDHPWDLVDDGDWSILTALHARLSPPVAEPPMCQWDDVGPCWIRDCARLVGLPDSADPDTVMAALEARVKPAAESDTEMPKL